MLKLLGVIIIVFSAFLVGNYRIFEKFANFELKCHVNWFKKRYIIDDELENTIEKFYLEQIMKDNLDFNLLGEFIISLLGALVGGMIGAIFALLSVNRKILTNGSLVNILSDSITILLMNVLIMGFIIILLLKLIQIFYKMNLYKYYIINKFKLIRKVKK